MSENNFNFEGGVDAKWPSIRASIEFDLITPHDSERKGPFYRDLCLLFDRLQERFNRLGAEEKEMCGLDGVAVEIFLRIDTVKKDIVLDKLFKYCDMDFHLFTELLEILQRHFPDCYLMVPTLQGYELAQEIRRFLGVALVECIYLKGRGNERLLLGDAIAEVSFEGILEDTKRHYEEQGGLLSRRLEKASPREISMYYRGKEGEEEVLWMQVRIALAKIL